MRILVEIAAHTIESALAAQSGGADRVELFSNYLEGGVTASAGLIAVAREQLSIDFQVMIRPRGGDFHYSGDEFRVMQRDIEAAKRLGANGVVLGLVNLDGTVDVERTGALVKLARPLAVTFHRAFDMCRDLPAALEDVISTGADRLLTSGGEATAGGGIEPLANLVRIAGSRVSLIAAGGITIENVCEIVQRTGVREVHAGLRSTVPSPMRFRNENIYFGPTGQRQYERAAVQEEDVRELIERVNGL